MDPTTTTTGGGGGGDLIGVGCVLSITPTIGDEIITGTVITYDRAANILLLREDGRHVRILNADCIKEFELLHRENDPIDRDRSFIPMKTLAEREEAAIRAATLETERMGKDVTKEAQNIYDELSKTLPVSWDGPVIVVMKEVRVSSPYTSGDVSGGTAAANIRVKRVLELVRKKMLGSRGP